MDIHLICRNPDADRIVPRMVRYLQDAFGWTVDTWPRPNADLNYYLGYFEFRDGKRHIDEVPSAAYFSHRDDDMPGKVAMWHKAAQTVTLRLATAEKYVQTLQPIGRTRRIILPLDTERFTIAPLKPAPKPRVGMSAFLYKSGRKGDHLIHRLHEEIHDTDVQLVATGRGFPFPYTTPSYDALPAFFQSLNVFVCTSLIEGGPMTTLEAMSCGIPVVIPRDVGIHDEIPETDGVFKYDKNDYDQLRDAIYLAVDWSGDRENLRNIAGQWSIEGWVRSHHQHFYELLNPDPIKRRWRAPEASEGKRGVYMAAYGEPALKASNAAVAALGKNTPDVPIKVVTEAPVGSQDIYIQHPDLDIGGRQAKLMVDRLAPAEWDFICYMDADTEVMSDEWLHLFHLLEQGWDFVICKDAWGREELTYYARGTGPDYDATLNIVGTERSLLFNGGVWAYRRSERMTLFFDTWLSEWQRFGARDQGSLLRALWQVPIRFYVLPTYYNHVDMYAPQPDMSAAIMHYPMQARRWFGRFSERLDSEAAFKMVEQVKAEGGPSLPENRKRRRET